MNYTLSNTKLDRLASKLRACTQLPEFDLWQQLQSNISDYYFQRQHLLDEYIVDCYCPELKLVIEIDGDSHNLKHGQQNSRYQYFKSLGIRILRFTNTEIKEDLSYVLREVKDFVKYLECHNK